MGGGGKETAKQHHQQQQQKQKQKQPSYKYNKKNYGEHDLHNNVLLATVQFGLWHNPTARSNTWVIYGAVDSCTA